MIGKIYIIKNTVNNKVYVGQTIKSLSDRLKRHIYDAYKMDDMLDEYVNNSKFYRAIRKYGKDVFYIELLENCSVGELNDKEIYYIDKYNSYIGGYNSTLGGDGTFTIKMTDDDILNIVNKYINGTSISKLAKMYNVSFSSIKNVLVANEVSLRDDKYSGIEIVMYDEYFNPQNVFKSKTEAYNYINNIEHMCRFTDFWKMIDKSIIGGNIAYGHRWQLASDLVYEDKIFRTKFDKEAYIQGEDVVISDNGKYYTVESTLSKLFGANSKYNINTLYCKCCGKIIHNRSITLLCKSCSQVNAMDKSPKPSKEELKALLDRGMQKKQIAHMYGRTDSTVHYWIKSYGLDSRNSRCIKVTCVEEGLTFNSLLEAAMWITDKTGATDVNSVSYAISKAVKNNKKYRGYTWI